MLAAINLIPDPWQTGPLNEIIMIGAVLAAVGVVMKLIVIPVLRWLRSLALAIETAASRLADIPNHEDRLDSMERHITEIRDALRPTNGDRRSISDRLDTVKQQNLSNSQQILELRGKVDDLFKGDEG
jgi:uncharacterized membrane protein YhiD involved in acid resistance